MSFHDIAQLKNWFLQEKRSFPWRETKDPYAIWVSEVMLQQTRASVVIDYFLKWMKKFPTIEALARASLEEVIKTWEGLGYYSRARNLKLGAEYVLSQYQGTLPSSIEDLRQIKGIGPYTAGAIASFAFQQKAAAIDGNVVRVIARYFCMEEEIHKGSAKKKLEEHVLSLLPENEPWVAMEALIELGALICQPSAKCDLCPLHRGCLSHKQGKVHQIPTKKKRKTVVYLYKKVILAISDQHLLVQKQQEGKVLGGLFEFPSFEMASGQEEEENLLEKYGLRSQWMQDFPVQYQTFTHHVLELYPSCYQIIERKNVVGYSWKPYNELLSLPFSSGHKRILHLIAKEFKF